ncbi:DNA damage inducible protein DinF [Erysipelotrichaceae bacterium]|nr:DNA damage inducible protein DinF [Erysipelotrichaceae bacterium]
MQQKMDMTTGKIEPLLLKLAIPIILGNFIQTASGMVNMIWVGHLGSDAVAAIGTAGFFVNLAIAFSTLIVIGAGVRISQTIGANQPQKTAVYIKTSLVLAVIVSIIFSIVIGVSAPQLISFFNMNNPVVEQAAQSYLEKSLVGIPFLFLATLFTTILTSYGDTTRAFHINAAGFILNIILDPLFIFGIGIFPQMGTDGAAVATTLARMITAGLFIFFSKKYLIAPAKEKISYKKAIEIMKLSFPVTLQRVIFIFITIYMAKIIVQFGTEAIAVQKIGVQIESVTYLTIGGVQGAIAAFIGQNYGANKIDRIAKGYYKALALVTGFGIIVGIGFVLFPRQLFSIFISDEAVISGGVIYMVTLAISQVFMCWELLSVGAFNGMGKTYAPPIVSIIFSLLRIPMALIFAHYIGLPGIWLSISISSIIKGILLVVWYSITIKKAQIA